MSKNSLYASEVDYAILKALKDSHESLRYNELHREASKVLGRRIWIKTFNEHLKKLCENREVIRNEKSRFNVTYEPARKYTEEELRVSQLWKLLDQYLSQSQNPRFRKRIIKGYIRHITSEGAISVFTILDALNAFAKGKEKEAQAILDEFFYRTRKKLTKLLGDLSKFEGIVKVADEVKEEEVKRLNESIRELVDKIAGGKKIQTLFRSFKSIKRRGWLWQAFGDVVEVDGKYHSFLWTSTIDDIDNSTFIQISKKKTVLYDDKTSEHYLRTPYMAWFIGTYSERLLSLLHYLEKEELSKTTAIYCLNLHRSACFVYNNTDTVVFKQFERFLEDNGFRLTPFQKPFLTKFSPKT